MNERELQTAVIECAQLLGWKVAHFRPALTGKGWRTPVEADGAGFPDLVCVRHARMLVLELKSDRGRMSVAQVDWLAAFQAAGVEALVLVPADWESGFVEKLLRGSM